ncbi:hypothetical protein DPMN_136558 [Dreissena polymorpha]|uniref:Uncharacterized protein n=1 Tax=Dreissena polymorpha TaxID=45954 RepID=A0A9D4JDW4_DREPO|nr:hypothetical protein DPMN_136558 [Dreissena polymorpha]
MCDPSATPLSRTTSYIADNNYPEGIVHSGCCACVFESSAASATIAINVIDMKLYDEASDCNQTLFVETNGIVTTYNCSHNNNFTLTTLITVVNTATVTLKNDVNSVGRGRLWVKATGTVCDTNREDMNLIKLENS